MVRYFERALYLFVFPFLFLCSCIQEETSTEDVVVIGSKLPDFTVVMNDGRIVTGALLRETVAVVMFFHTCCPDCQQVLPHVQLLYDEYAQQGVTFTLISREESDESIETYWSDAGLMMPYSAQKDRKVYELFAYSRVPRIYICGIGGTVQYVFTDNPVPTYESLKMALDELL